MMNMMYGNWGMMSGAGWFMGLFGIVVLVDLILLGIWLWQNIGKN